MSKWFFAVSQVTYLLRSLLDAYHIYCCMVMWHLMLVSAEGAVDNDIKRVSFLAHIVKTSTIVFQTH